MTWSTHVWKVMLDVKKDDFPSSRNITTCIHHRQHVVTLEQPRYPSHSLPILIVISSVVSLLPPHNVLLISAHCVVLLLRDNVLVDQVLMSLYTSLYKYRGHEKCSSCYIVTNLQVPRAHIIFLNNKRCDLQTKRQPERNVWKQEEWKRCRVCITRPLSRMLLKLGSDDSSYVWWHTYYTHNKVYIWWS